MSWWHRNCLRDNERINLTVDTLILWCIRGSVLDFKILKICPTSCLVRLFATLTAVLPLAFRLQMLHFAYKTCISFTNRAFDFTNLHFTYNCCSSFFKCGIPFYNSAVFIILSYSISQKCWKCKNFNSKRRIMLKMHYKKDV